MKIKEIKARAILNSKSIKTIEVEVTDKDNFKATASVGTGTSTGKYEVNAFPKKGINYTINYFNNILRNKLQNLTISNFDDLEKIERIFNAEDYTEKLDKLGGNIIVSTEFAILKALSKGDVWKVLNSKAKKIPTPLCNVIGGGHHAGINSPDIQEFLLLPQTKKFEEALWANISLYHKLDKELTKRNFDGRKTIEGAYCPDMNNIEILNILSKVTEKFSKENKIDIGIGIDVAANSLWNGRKYQYKKFAKFKQKKNLNREEQIEFMEKLIKNYNLIYVEDPLNEDDFEGFSQLNNKTCLITGDDLTTTNPERIKMADKKISAVIIKPNQIGSLLKTKEVIDFARKNKITPVISHRSGETEDNILAHLAVGFDCPIIKTGINR